MGRIDNKSKYIYLHGFASSPKSHKAQYLRDRFSQSGINLKILDLNGGDFSHLTLTRQLQQIAAALPDSDIPVTIIGSSFGGLTAAWLAEKFPQVQRLLLLAPAFKFLSHWLPILGEKRVKQWQESGYISIYHYGEGRSLPLHYQFVTDLNQYSKKFQRQIPTLILHGRKDDVIPIQSSPNYLCHRPWVELIELESDHTLTDKKTEIMHYIPKSLPAQLGG